MSNKNCILVSPFPKSAQIKEVTAAHLRHFGSKRYVNIESILKSQKRLIATQLKPRKGKDIKWILIENIYSLFRELFL
jgi:hypothetical protein